MKPDFVWIMDVLSDVQAFALANGLRETEKVVGWANSCVEHELNEKLKPDPSVLLRVVEKTESYGRE